MEIEFYREEAPITVRNFEYLGKKRFYENLTFHRYVPDFVIQGGDPQGNGKGGPGYGLPPEHSSVLKHRRGTLGMARLPSEVNPERLSNGSQFYICFSLAPHLDGLYTVFAQVISGMENAEKLRQGDKILEVQFP
ncbi:MAG: peptidylprolyl isomerase [Deltaproteobacteria bacterium]|nr:peptidylprolyl isomerase [Deltaproteobacteria bacterium]